jgi:hypothetical protein
VASNVPGGVALVNSLIGQTSVKQSINTNAVSPWALLAEILNPTTTSPASIYNLVSSFSAAPASKSVNSLA